MATQTITRLVDDLEPALNLDAAETVSFALDGVSYEIDLSEDNAHELRELLAVYVARARRTGGRVQRGRPAPVRPAQNGGGTQQDHRAHMRAVREWARAHGFTQANGRQLSNKGRIPVRVLEAYENRDAVNSKVIMNEKGSGNSPVNGGTVTELPVVPEKANVSQARSTSRRPRPVSGTK